MRVAYIASLGAIGVLIVGGAAGLLVGIAWINFFGPGNFEGYVAMIVCFVFIPIGALLGGFIGAVWRSTARSRARPQIKPER